MVIFILIKAGYGTIDELDFYYLLVTDNKPIQALQSTHLHYHKQTKKAAHARTALIFKTNSEIPNKNY